MKKFLAISLLLALCITLVAQDRYYTPAQKKLMARRAAIVDGYRQLAEAIKGVKITSTTTVKDFVTERDEIKAEMDSFVIRGAQVVAEQFLADGTYEVEMEVKMDDLALFVVLARDKYNLSRWPNVSTEEMHRQNNSRVIRAKGTGAVPGGMSESEIQRLKTENESMKTELATLKTEIANLKAIIADDQKIIQSLSSSKSENEGMRVVIVNLKAEIATMKEKLLHATGFQHIVLKLRSENASLKQQLQKMTKEKLLITQEKHSLRETLVRLQREGEAMRAYRQQYDSLLTQYRQMQERIESLRGYEEKYKILLLIESKLKGQLAALQHTLASYQEYKAKSEEYLNKYQEASQKLSSLQSQLNELPELQNRVAGLQTMIQKLSQEKEALRLQLATQSQTQTKLLDAEKQNQSLVTENARLLSQVQNLQKEIVELKAHNTELQAEINNLKSSPQGTWVKATGQQKLMARRAAILDGYRLLLESLHGVRIDSKTTVKDFVTQDDQINAATSGFVRGAQISAARYLQDGTCEVEMYIELDLFVRFLKQTARQHGRWEPERFNDIYKYEKRNRITVTGTGTFK
jgi:hypothetical protein